MKSLSSIFNSDVSVAIGVIMILAVMILPMPIVLLDTFFALNISLSILILFAALYSVKPLDFSVFPSVLLLSTMFRLALNIASTRAILQNGNRGAGAAGKVVQTFGSFVVGGNYFIGIIVFLILVVVNFMVITRGSGRIAEVAARFTLDAMPGKQMAIDADLNAGIINEQVAQARRQEIQREADFFGSMDGASKFVRGDAIAGLMITGINIIGGLIIGTLMYDMDLSRAGITFTSLTIGDGLVSQIPALVISLSAGIITAKAGAENRLGTDLKLQVFGNPLALGLSSISLLIFGMVPGMPKLSFFTLAAVLGYATWFVIAQKRKLQEQLQTQQDDEEEAKLEETHDNILDLLPIDVLGLELGYALIPLVDTEQDGELLERVKAIRKQIALDFGIVVPPIHIKDNLQLESGVYSLTIKGIEVGQGEMMMGHYLAMEAGEVLEEVDGLPTKEPAFGLDGLWVAESDREQAEIAGYTVVDIPTVISTHLTEIIKNHAYEFLGRQETQKLLDKVAETEPKVVEDLIPDSLTLGTVQRVLQGMLKEYVSIRDMTTILEILSDAANYTKIPEVLVEQVREGLARNITRQYQTEEGIMPVMTFDMSIENELVDAVQDTGQGSYLAIDPDTAQNVLNTIERGIEVFASYNYQPIILCSPMIRVHIKRLTERAIPNLVVLSHNEITPDIRLESLGVLAYLTE